MPVFTFIAFLGALVLAVAGGGGVWFYDHHAPLHWRGPIPFVGPTISLPDSLQTQRDLALAQLEIDVADVKACRANTATLQAAVTAQNAAVERLAAESHARVAESQHAAQAAASVAQGLRERAGVILAEKPDGADLCAAADRLILQEAGR